LAMKLDVLNSAGKKVETVAVSDQVWDAPLNGALLHQVVMAQQANRRQGDHESQDRRDVSSSTRKLHPQKVGGRARLGSRSSPSMVGGAVAHGPHNRDYTQRTPIKMRRQALFAALSDKLRNGRVMVIKKFDAKGLKTASLAKMLTNLKIERRALLVSDDIDRDLLRVAANIKSVTVATAPQINALDITRAHTVVFTAAAVDKVEATWGKIQIRKAAASAGG